MIKTPLSLLITGLIIILSATLLLDSKVFGTSNACVAALSTNSALPNSLFDLNIQVNNNGIQPIRWVKLNSPSDKFVISTVNGTDWAGTHTPSIATFKSGSIAPDANYNKFVLSIQVASNKSAFEAWTVQASANSNGDEPFSCDDSGLSLSINDGIAPVISNISAVAHPTSVEITWLTDQPSTSKIEYGTNDQYGSSSAQDNNLTTSHVVTITGLIIDTGYHYQISATDIASNYVTSNDNTFITAAEPVVMPPVIPPVKVIPVTKPTDKTPPTVIITSSLPSVVQNIPQVSGTASDNTLVKAIEYSTDGGLNWLPVDSTTSLDSKLASFSFTPSNLSDGNYKFMVRAFDGGGNVATTPAINVVVDRLPPIIGGIILSSGPQLLLPNNAGTFTSIVNIDQKITLSAVGGPTSINLVAEKIGSKTAVSQVFTLTESADTGLWSGIVSFTSSGKYNLTSIAIDGAGNKTSQKIGVIDVSSNPFTYSLHTKKPVKSTVSLYYFEPLSSTWVLWDGSSYGQSNPQTTSSKGTFQLFLPKGKYYLKVTSAGYKPLVSSIFTSDQSQPFTTNIGMKSSNGINIGPIHISWPSINMQKVKLPANPDAQLKSSKNELIGKVLPDFNLINTNGDTVTATSLLGRPTLVTIGSTWSPLMSEQLTALANLQANKDVNIVPIALQETAGKVKAYISIAGLSLTWLVDPDSSISPEYGTPYSPTNYFVDRDGVIKQVVVGVMSQVKIEEILGSL